MFTYICALSVVRVIWNEKKMAQIAMFEVNKTIRQDYFCASVIFLPWAIFW